MHIVDGLAYKFPEAKGWIIRQYNVQNLTNKRENASKTHIHSQLFGIIISKENKANTICQFSNNSDILVLQTLDFNRKSIKENCFQSFRLMKGTQLWKNA